MRSAPGFLFLLLLAYSCRDMAAQTNELILPSPLQQARFGATTLKQARKDWNAPDKESDHFMLANLGGGCLHFYHTVLQYDSIGSIYFFSDTPHPKNKRRLSEICITSPAVSINDSIHTGSSDTATVANTFGIPCGESREIYPATKQFSWTYRLLLNGEQVEVRFIFDEEGVLEETDISGPAVRL